MEQTWRWFGPEDAVPLAWARQAGATGIVSALHHIPYGVVWTREEILKRKAEIEGDPGLGLTWSVVESLPVAEPIKTGEGDLTPLFDAYRASLRNLAACGIRTVCYNFMPLLDWTRTQLAVPLPGGGRALRFEYHEYVAFDAFVLERPGALEGVDPAVADQARAWFEASTAQSRQALLDTIMAGLPGAFERYDVPGLRAVLQRYRGMTAEDLRANLIRFLQEVVPTAQEVGVRLCIHPDDPPRPIFGLPRVVSTRDDIAAILDAVQSPANGLTLCSGSLGARWGNDVVAIAEEFADRVHFAHLRNVTKSRDGSFTEAEHLGGDTDMVALIEVLLKEEARRRSVGREDWRIPLRPDHGHELMDDATRKSHPGYPAVGRLRGLAELRGVIVALSRELQHAL